MKKYFFTCCSIVNQSLVAETYFVCTRDEAYDMFKQTHSVPPTFLDGPFYRKLEKNKKKVEQKSIKLSNKFIKSSYKGFPVKAILLQEPKDYAYLIFLNEKPNNSMNNMTNIVHISELKD